jgi:hypothetical protein
MLRPLSRRVVACYVSSASTSDARFQRFPVSGRHLSQFVIPSVPRNLEIKRVPRPCLSAFWRDKARISTERGSEICGGATYVCVAVCIEDCATVNIGVYCV